MHDGDAAHLLDIYTLADAEEGAAPPVIVDFHGGGLYYGNKENNECRDMLLARQGFAVVNANYRLVPSASFPAELADAMAGARLDSRPWRRIRPVRRARLRDRRFGRRRLGPVPLRGQRFDAAGRRLGACGSRVHRGARPGGDLRHVPFAGRRARQCAELLHGGLPGRPPTTSRSTPISIWTSSSWTAMCPRRSR